MVVGAFNGAVIVYGRVNSVIATLGGLAAYKGIAEVVSDGRAQGYVLNNATFVFISRGKIFGVPTMVWIFAAVALFVFVLLNYTDIGRNIYASVATTSRLALLASPSTSTSSASMSSPARWPQSRASC